MQHHRKTTPPSGKQKARARARPNAATTNARAQTATNADLPWDDVRLFLALCRVDTLRGAAQALGVDAATVSRRLSALEARLSATLFERGRDGISITAAAEQLMPVAEEIEGLMLRFCNAAQTLERSVEGVVRLTCPSDVAQVLVTPLVPVLRHRHPGLRLELHASETIVDLTRGEADLALRTVRPTRGDLIVSRVATTRWVAVASPQLAKQIGRLNSFGQVPWLGWSERFADLPAARWMSRYLGVAEPAVRCDSLTLLLTLVAESVGVALVPELSAAHHGLVPVALSRRLTPEAASWPRSELYLVTHRALQNVPRVRAVWDGLLEQLRQLGTKSS